MSDDRIAMRELDVADGERFRALRLSMLEDAAFAYGASPEDEALLTPAQMAQRIARSEDNVAVGAFDGERLVGVAVMSREMRPKVRHRAVIWGVYVEPNVRGRGVARRLMQGLIDRAPTLPGLHHLGLTVTSTNAGAFALYESLGFIQYGEHPAGLFVDGEYLGERLMWRPASTTAVPA